MNVAPANQTSTSDGPGLGPTNNARTSNAPAFLKIGIDVYANNGKPTPMVQVAHTVKMTPENYIEAVGKAFEPIDFNFSVDKYECDICSTRTSKENPIYTNPDHIGCDICTNCVEKAFRRGIVTANARQSPFENCYRLSDFMNLVKNMQDDDV